MKNNDLFRDGLLGEGAAAMSPPYPAETLEGGPFST